MSHPAKSLPPAPRLIAHVGANWQHDLLEQARINSQRGNGCSCSAGVLGHARDWFSVSQVMPEAAQAQVREGLQKVRVCVCHSLCVSPASHPAQRSSPAPGSNAGGPDGQTGSAAQPGAALCEEGDTLSLTRSFTAPGFTNPGGFYNPLGCEGVCPGKGIHRTLCRSHFSGVAAACCPPSAFRDVPGGGSGSFLAHRGLWGGKCPAQGMAGV